VQAHHYFALHLRFRREGNCSGEHEKYDAENDEPEMIFFVGYVTHRNDAALRHAAAIERDDFAGHITVAI
jgi:hypothetical protein